MSDIDTGGKLRLTMSAARPSYFREGVKTGHRSHRSLHRGRGGSGFMCLLPKPGAKKIKRDIRTRKARALRAAAVNGLVRWEEGIDGKRCENREDE